MMHFGGQLSYNRTSSGNLVSQKIHELGNVTVPILFEIRYDGLKINVPAEKASIIYSADT